MSKKQDTPIKKNAFVHKLYSMLNDSTLSHLIWWTRDEESNMFALSPGKEFAQALTGYFKHGNVASFVRQLHMYGFHKVSDPNHMNVSNEKDLPVWEFKHSSGKFKKNDESSLVYIKRRSSSNNSRNVYNNENDANVVIPTSTPSPDHVHYVNDSGHPYMPPGYYYYNHTHLRPHLSFPPPQGAQQQQPHHSMYYTQKQMPRSSNPHTFSSENVFDQNRVAEIQRSISPQSQPNQSHAPQKAPTSQPQPNTSSTPHTPQPRPQSQTPQSHHLQGVQQEHQPQQYTPNLQFRKIWETNSQQSRPRNPSLLFDPLAPAPIPAQLQPPVSSQQSQLQSSSYLLSRSEPGSTFNTRDSVTGSGSRDSFASARDSFASARDSFASPRDSFTLTKDPENNRLSIKLPPPSSIHRNSSLYASGSSFSSNSDSSSSTIINSNLPARLSPNEGSLSGASSSPTMRQKANSTSDTLNSNPKELNVKKASTFPSHSNQEKLRPSLIELHFGSSTKTSILNPQHNSIGSVSSHNSVFSNDSSLSSGSSIHRTSSFGSISHCPFPLHKNSISIAPHEPVPNAHISKSLTEASDQESFFHETKESKGPTSPPYTKSYSSYQKVNTHPPIKRSATSLGPASSAPPFPLKIRSLTSSPLSKSFASEDNKTDPLADPNLKTPITKVSVHSLLDDGIKNKNINVIRNDRRDDALEQNEGECEEEIPSIDTKMLPSHESEESVATKDVTDGSTEA